MAHIRDYKVANLLKQKAAEFFIHECGLDISIVDAVMIDKRTLHLFYRPTNMYEQSADALELKHRIVLDSLPKLRHYVAKNTVLKSIPTIHLKLSVLNEYDN